MKLAGIGLVCVSLFAVVAPAYAAVTVQVPENIVVLGINGQEVKSGFLNRDKNYQLAEGAHQLQLRYQQYFELSNTEHDIVRSGVIQLQTPVLKDGETYRLVTVDSPEEHEQAKDYAKNPVIAIYDQKNQLVVQHQGAIASTGLFGQLFSPSATVNAVSIAPSTPAVSTTPVAPKKAVESVVNTSRDQQLIELWKQATPAERQKFTAWLANPTN